MILKSAIKQHIDTTEVQFLFLPFETSSLVLDGNAISRKVIMPW